MPKFRKKPVVVEAVQLPVDPYDPGFIVNAPLWFAEAVNQGDEAPGSQGSIYPNEDDGSLMVGTPEGSLKANPLDWIIRGVKGEIYPCKPDIFEKTYDEVKDDRI